MQQPRHLVLVDWQSGPPSPGLLEPWGGHELDLPKGETKAGDKRRYFDD